MRAAGQPLCASSSLCTARANRSPETSRSTSSTAALPSRSGSWPSEIRQMRRQEDARQVEKLLRAVTGTHDVHLLAAGGRQVAAVDWLTFRK